MITIEDFEQQKMPRSGANNALETYSRKRLHAMFDPEHFEVRDETQHDVGIDLFIELKSKNENINLRFPIQLKAARGLKKNRDGSISLQVKTRNVQYLMNDGLPAYYVLYHKQEDVFYHKRAQDVARMLKEKYPDGKLPASCTIKFDQRFDTEAIKKIRSEMLGRGFLRRNLNDVLSLGNDHKSLKDSIVIRKDLKIHSPSEALRYLETFGHQMLNKGAFNYILEIEKDCYPLDEGNPSAKFHFICGTAAHYTGKLHDALAHFKKAERQIEKLHPETRTLMRYYIAHSKLSLGMIDKKKNSEAIEALMESEYFGLFLRLEKAYESYRKSKESPDVRVAQFRKTMENILASPNCSDSLRLTAESYLLDLKANELNEHLLHYLLMGRDFHRIPFFNPEDHNVRKQNVTDYNQHFRELLERAKRENNWFIYQNISLGGIMTQYVKTYYTAMVMGINLKTLVVNPTFSDDEKDMMKYQADYCGEIAERFRDVSASRNMMTALTQQYELLHLSGNLEQAAVVHQKMSALVTENDWDGLEQHLDNLKNGKTSHEQFVTSLIARYSNTDQYHR